MQLAAKSHSAATIAAGGGRLQIGRGPAPWPISTMSSMDDGMVLGTIASKAKGRPWIVSDLSFGSWRGHWIAREISAQLGLPQTGCELFPPIGISRGSDRSHADTIRTLIDRESAGEVNRQSAHQHASSIVEALLAHEIGAVVIVAPQPGVPWEREDVWLLRLLSSGLARTPVSLILLVPGQGNGLPPGFCPVPMESIRASGSPPYSGALPAVCASVPGLLPPAVEFSRGTAPTAQVLCVETPRGFRWILPSQRDFGRREVEPSQIERTMEIPDWLRAYYYCGVPSRLRDVALLHREAAKRFAEGAYQIAIRLIEKASETAADSPRLLAALESQGQAMRVAMMDFAAAAGRELDLQVTPDEFRGTLALAKAWGLVMTNRSQEAEPLFQLAAAASRNRGDTALELYTLNISALNRLRLGLVEDAFALEHEIENRLRECAEPMWHIVYVNAMNLARLYRTGGNHSKARKQYLRAFSINSGLRSESDQVYFNLCQGKLEEAAGLKESALISYLRAAIHWLAMSAPEALAPRVVLAMLEREERLPDDPVEPVSQYLGSRIGSLSGAGPSEDGDIHGAASPASIGFARVVDVAPPVFADLTALGARGWGVFHTGMLSLPRCTGEAYASLRMLVLKTIARFQPHWKIPRCGTFLVDDEFGVELPVDGSKMLDAAVRLRCTQIYFSEVRISLTAKDIESIELQSIVRLGLGVDGLLRIGDRATVTFRRYLTAEVLSGLSAAIIPHARSGIRVADLASVLQVPAQLMMEEVRELERKHVLRVAREHNVDEKAAIPG